MVVFGLGSRIENAEVKGTESEGRDHERPGKTLGIAWGHRRNESRSKGGKSNLLMNGGD